MSIRGRRIAIWGGAAAIVVVAVAAWKPLARLRGGPVRPYVVSL